LNRSSSAERTVRLSGQRVIISGGRSTIGRIRSESPALALSLLLAAGCGRPPSSLPPGNDLLIVGYDREPDTLNRFATHILEDTMICIVEGLTVWDENMRPVPVLAERLPSPENGLVQLNPDGSMVVTWKLRPGIRWHDGAPFTSGDVKFTVEAINDPAYNPESTDGFERIERVETPDPLTAVVHYREVYAPYQDQFWRGCLPRHLLAGKDLNRSPFYDRDPLGTGPYRVKEWKTGEYLLLERNPNYWRGPVKIRQILFRFLTNTNTRLNQLRAGEVHLVDNVPLDKVREAEAIPGLTVTRTVANSYVNLSLNQKTVPAFRDLRVRQALAQAIDRQAIARDLLGSVVTVVNSVIQPPSWAHNPKVEFYPYDPEGSRRLLAEAGWEDGDGDGTREKNGQPLSFIGSTRAGHAEWERVLQLVQAQLKAVGVRMEIRNYEPTLLGEMWFAGETEVFLSAWTLQADPELTLFFAADRTPPQGRNIYFHQNPELTRILYASDRTVEHERRKALLFQAQEIVAREVPLIPLYNRTLVSAFPRSLRQVKPNPTNAGLFWNVHEWEVVGNEP
jgi:peptide/nickel transport system substrate-binding protein